MTENEYEYVDKQLKETYHRLNALSSEFSNMKTEIGYLGQHIANAINESGQAVASMVAANTKQIQGSLKETSSFAGQVELAKHMAELRTTGDVVALMQEALTSKVETIQKRKELIREQFCKKEDDIADSYRRDIREIGAHIYEPLECGYYENIESRFHRGRTRNQLAHNVIQQVEANRKKALRERWHDCSSRVKELIADRKKFRDVVSVKSCKSSVGGTQIRKVHIPFWRVVREEGSAKIISPSVVHKGAGIWSLKANGNFKGTIPATRDIQDRLCQGETVSMTSGMQNLLCEEIEKMGRGGADSGVINVLKDLVKNRPALLSREVQS